MGCFEGFVLSRWGIFFSRGLYIFPGVLGEFVHMGGGFIKKGI